VEEERGKTLADYIDETPPTVVSVVPADGSSDVKVGSLSGIEVNFSEKMEESAINETSFLIKAGSSDCDHQFFFHPISA